MSEAATSAIVTWANPADANDVATHIATAIEDNGARLLAVPGGTTPVAIFDRLSTMDLPWNKLSLMLTDDRIVAKDHEASNFGKLTKAFENSDAQLIELTDGMIPPRADLVWIGMGVDGHIASLFPTMKGPARGDEKDPMVVRTVPEPLPSEAPFERLSLNMAALINTNELIIVVRGADKKTILEKAIRKEHDLPIARLIKDHPAGEEIVIVDIGGGTSDYTAFEQGADGAARVLASHGLRLGGTDFDRRLSIDHVMPLLGRGSQIRNSFGPGTLPAPNRIFNDLATWQMIPFLYAPDSRRNAKDLARQAAEPEKLNRLVTVLEDELGHDLAFAVERGKILANQPDHPEPKIDLRILERGLSVPLTPADLQSSLNAETTEILTHASETLALADLSPERVDRIILVGGSSLLNDISDGLQVLCPNAQIEADNAMTAIADGLALAAETAFA